MIHDLDETLKQLLIQKAGLDPAEVDISFDVPTREWSTPVTRPTVNLYLYDIRENRALRQPMWEEPQSRESEALIKRSLVRIDLSYLITCWTSAAEDQHRLLWRVLQTFMRHSPLPEDTLQGELRGHVYPLRTEVAQPDGVLRNVSDFWGALDNQLRPAISLVVTLELDLEEQKIAPLVFAQVLKIGQRSPEPGHNGRPAEILEPGWEVFPLVLAGRVVTETGVPVPGASVRLLGRTRGGAGRQIGPTRTTDADGRYLFAAVPPGAYTLVVEVPGQAPQQQSLIVAAVERGEELPPVTHEVIVPIQG